MQTNMLQYLSDNFGDYDTLNIPEPAPLSLIVVWSLKTSKFLMGHIVPGALLIRCQKFCNPTN